MSEISRRTVLRGSGATIAGYFVVSRLGFEHLAAETQGLRLSDPRLQPMFEETVPNALDPSFIYDTRKGKIKVAVASTRHYTGLRSLTGDRQKLPTTIYGYGANREYTWPGKTFEVQSGEPLEVKWENRLPTAEYLIQGTDNSSLGTGFFDNRGRSVVDTNLHWAYSLAGYDRYSIAKDGVPIVTHLHGGHNDSAADGNPEYFFSPGWSVRGPQWVSKKYDYDNSQEAGTLWYHDHTLGITRLNVYAGMAGFYIIRDGDDTGRLGNGAGLPAHPYEAAFAIQDRMFKDTGELFYPAFPGDIYYSDFIDGEDAVLPSDLFPQGGPTGLAEFFGDHMVVNGKIWPKMNVEPRNYRFRLLNGCDSRFLAIQLFEVPAGETDFSEAKQIDFTVIGSDQGLASSPTTQETLLIETGSRYDIIVDFKQVEKGNRVIMKNVGGDEPFGGALPGVQEFGETDRIMAFDVVMPIDTAIPDPGLSGIALPARVLDPPTQTTRIRKVALFEGKDEFGRLQPLLGTAEPAEDHAGNPINWPEVPKYSSVGLTGQMEGSIAWHSPTTENPALNSTEVWELWNMTGDAHPVHLHLVNFEILGRSEISFDSNADDDGLIPDGSTPAGDGTYLVPQATVQHNSVAGDPSTYGVGFKVLNPTTGGVVSQPPEYVENAPKDMVTALPGQVTRIKATFDKPGRYVWHCHILSHEDHEMMRVMHVGEGA